MRSLLTAIALIVIAAQAFATTHEERCMKETEKAINEDFAKKFNIATSSTFALPSDFFSIVKNKETFEVSHPANFSFPKELVSSFLTEKKSYYISQVKSCAAFSEDITSTVDCAQSSQQKDSFGDPIQDVASQLVAIKISVGSAKVNKSKTPTDTAERVVNIELIAQVYLMGKEVVDPSATSKIKWTPANGVGTISGPQYKLTTNIGTQTVSGVAKFLDASAKYEIKLKEEGEDQIMELSLSGQEFQSTTYSPSSDPDSSEYALNSEGEFEPAQDTSIVCEINKTFEQLKELTFPGDLLEKLSSTKGPFFFCSACGNWSVSTTSSDVFNEAASLCSYPPGSYSKYPSLSTPSANSELALSAPLAKCNNFKKIDGLQCFPLKKQDKSCLSAIGFKGKPSKKDYACFGNDSFSFAKGLKKAVSKAKKSALPTLDWGNKDWTEALVDNIRKSDLPDLTPADAEILMPGYSEMSREKRVVAWSKLMVKLSKDTSSFNPNAANKENITDKDGKKVVSRGLFLLSKESANSPSYGCAIKSEIDLKDPKTNIACATKIMSHLVKKENSIASPLTLKPSGAAKYWSVLQYKESATAPSENQQPLPVAEVEEVIQTDDNPPEEQKPTKPSPSSPIKCEADEFPWKKELQEAIAANKLYDIVPRDANDFCPGYRGMINRDRSACWLKIMVAISKRESGFDPNNTFYEESLKEWSEGLFALSLSDANKRWKCPFKTRSDVKNPKKNIDCATKIMATLVNEDEYISGHRQGAAKYWSTLRSPYYYAGMKLGAKDEIIMEAAAVCTPQSPPPADWDDKYIKDLSKKWSAQIIKDKQAARIKKKNKFEESFMEALPALVGFGAITLPGNNLTQNQQNNSFSYPTSNASYGYNPMFGGGYGYGGSLSLYNFGSVPSYMMTMNQNTMYFPNYTLPSSWGR